MQGSGISQESLFFIQVENICHSPVITCGPELAVTEMARLMQRHHISGLVVVRDDVPVGIVTARDCRDLLAEGGETGGRRVGDIMRSTLVTIRRRDYVFEAIFKMARHNIQRLVVLDDEGRLAGILTDTDILRLQTRTPLYFLQEIEAAKSLEQLRAVNDRMLEMVDFATRAGGDTKSLVQLISQFNDALTLRVIALLDSGEGIRMPAGAAYLVLGSEGRGEQTLRTDQDSAIVYRDDLPVAEFPALERFARRLVAALEQIGVPPCPGNTMASNPQWRRSLGEWKAVLDQWISVPTPENMVNFGMFQNLRALHGEAGLERELRDHIRASIQRQSLFLAHMARHVVRFNPPLGWFGRIKVARRGEYRGKVDLKRAGIFAFTFGIGLLALEIGVVGGSTWEKIEELGKQGVLSRQDLEMLDEAFTCLVRMRLQRQLRDLGEGKAPSNHVDPLIMTDKVRDEFRQALMGVGTLLRIIRDRYKLDFISR